MKRTKLLWMKKRVTCALAIFAMLALAITALVEAAHARAKVSEARACVQANDHDDDKDRKGTVDVPLGSTGLVEGESLRATFTNLGPRRMSVVPCVRDADGVVVKQAEEPLVLEPGQMRTFEVSREEGPILLSADATSDQRSRLVRMEATIQRADAKNLMVTTEVVDESRRRVKFQLQVSIAIIAILIG